MNMLKNKARQNNSGNGFANRLKISLKKALVYSTVFVTGAVAGTAMSHFFFNRIYRYNYRCYTERVNRELQIMKERIESMEDETKNIRECMRSINSDIKEIDFRIVQIDVLGRRTDILREARINEKRAVYLAELEKWKNRSWFRRLLVRKPIPEDFGLVEVDSISQVIK